MMFQFGHAVGMCFQVRDDIFDYGSNVSIGKPTGNDMKEGKLTLPLIYALNSAGNERMFSLAQKVKRGEVVQEEIDELVHFTRLNGGIDYAAEVMNDFACKAKSILAAFPESDVRDSLMLYVDYVIQRNV